MTSSGGDIEARGTLRRLVEGPPPMRTWSGHGGIELAGDVWGEEGRPAVVLMHGGGQTRHAWKGTGQALADAGYFVVAFDGRGHGDSSWEPAGDYQLDPLIADLHLTTVFFRLSRPVVVGASMGGSVALAAVAERIVDASALVLVDIAHAFDESGADRVRAFMMSHQRGFASLDEAAEAIRSYQPHRRREGSHAGLAKNLRIGQDGRYYWHWDPQVLVSRTEMTTREHRLTTCAQALRCPTLLVRGGLSDVLTEKVAADFLELCPRAEFVNVAGASHMVAGDENDEFGGVVIEFLRRARPPEATT